MANEAPLKVSTSFGPLIGGESFLLKIGDINLCYQSQHLRFDLGKVKADLHYSKSNLQQRRGSSSASLGERHLRSEIPHQVVNTQVAGEAGMRDLGGLGARVCQDASV